MNEEEKEKEKEKQIILLEEYNNAWEHYRHLSDARTKYMNFFFTASFAVIGFLAAFIKFGTDLTDGEFESNKYDIKAIIIFSYVFNMFAVFVYINVVRIGHILFGYEKIIDVLRTYMYQNNIPKKINIREYYPMDNSIFSIHRSAKFLLLISLVLIFIFSLLMLCYNWCWVGNWRIPLLSIQIIMLVFEATIIYKDFTLKVKNTDPLPSPAAQN